MSKSYFVEGVVVGAIAGVIGTILCQDNLCYQENKIKKATEKTEEEDKSEKADKKEDVVAKTLDAIEKGFENLSKIVEDRKKKTVKK